MQAEIIALRHQLIVLQRTHKPKRLVLKPCDRCLWVCLSRLWSSWRSALIIVKPETVIGWHRQGFRWYWTWKVRHGKPGGPRIPKDTRELIRTMSRENPIWGAPRIHSELMKLAITISVASVAKYMVGSRKPPSQTWRTFLDNHVSQLASIDFFTVPRFGLMFCLSSSSWHTIDDALSTSTLQLIRRRNGPRGKCSKLFRSIRRLDICCEIGIGFMDRSFGIKSHG
jgi:hypothetical protein